MFRQVYVEITNSCNLSCSFCIQKHEEKRFLNIKQFEHILIQIKPYTNYIYLHILGEPLIHPYLDEILTLCEKYAFFVQITTNGTLLKTQKELLLKHKIRQFNVSIHSFKHQNENYLKEVLETCDELCNQSFISYRLWCMKNHQLDQDALKIYQAILDHYQITELKNYTLAKNRFISFDEVFTWPDMNLPYITNKGTCRGLKDMLGILSNGDVVPCCLDAYGQAKLGNIFEENLETILNHKIAKDIRNGFLNNQIHHPFCQRCIYRTRFDKIKK